MHTTQQIEYIIARNHFQEAELRGYKLIPGRIETSLWLHREGINLDTVIETARNFPDSNTFIIAEGPNRGFYIYSNQKKVCVKLVNIQNPVLHAESA